LVVASAVVHRSNIRNQGWNERAIPLAASVVSSIDSELFLDLNLQRQTFLADSDSCHSRPRLVRRYRRATQIQGNKMNNSFPTDPIVYTRPAAAKLLSISIRELDDLIAIKKIRPTRIGGGC